MTSFLSNLPLFKKDSSSSLSNRRKVKHFSYSPDDKIGKGYSSIVYRGLNELNNEVVAIKAIDMKGVKDAVSREMLDCQIEALTKLKHPNILKCYDVVREVSHCYIITEFCNEGDLSSLLKKKKRMSEVEVLKIMKDIVNGFVEIGERNFLHRDLKLANIFMSNGNALIADFGFAKKNTYSSQRERYNVGSPLYMSPEALKKNIYSLKNDIWSIGIMLFELLHGQTPWECKTQKQLMDKMIRVPIKFRDGLGISSEMRAFIRKCLDINEEARMGLAELKDWNEQNTWESIKKGEMVYLPNNPQLMKKPVSDAFGSKPLSEVTNRLSSRSQSNINPKSSKPVADLSLNNAMNKQNRAYQPKLALTKPQIEKNNNILVIEINTFRLEYKIFAQIKKSLPEQKETINVLGNDVVKRVSNLHSVVCPEQNQNENKGRTSSGPEYGLKDIQSYINEKANPGIKKYKSVVKEYYKKYLNEIKLAPLGHSITPKSTLTQILSRLAAKSLKQFGSSSQDLLLLHWMIEFVSMPATVKKEYLDGVIEPKNLQLTKQYLLQRIKEIL